MPICESCGREKSDVREREQLIGSTYDRAGQGKDRLVIAQTCDDCETKRTEVGSKAYNFWLKRTSE